MADQHALKAHILSLSQSTTFEIACREWGLVHIYVTEDWDNCPCGQDIKEHCEIANRLTGAQTFYTEPPSPRPSRSGAIPARQTFGMRACKQAWLGLYSQR